MLALGRKDSFTRRPSLADLEVTPCQLDTQVIISYRHTYEVPYAVTAASTGPCVCVASRADRGEHRHALRSLDYSAPYHVLIAAYTAVLACEACASYSADQQEEGVQRHSSEGSQPLPAATSDYSPAVASGYGLPVASDTSSGVSPDGPVSLPQWEAGRERHCRSLCRSHRRWPTRDDYGGPR